MSVLEAAIAKWKSIDLFKDIVMSVYEVKETFPTMFFMQEVVKCTSCATTASLPLTGGSRTRHRATRQPSKTFRKDLEAAIMMKKPKQML